MPSANGDKSDQDALITGRIGELRMVKDRIWSLDGNSADGQRIHHRTRCYSGGLNKGAVQGRWLKDDSKCSAIRVKPSGCNCYSSSSSNRPADPSCARVGELSAGAPVALLPSWGWDSLDGFFAQAMDARRVCRFPATARWPSARLCAGH
jgi:hypothetical protein